jgi:hypothetical protein
MAENTVPGWTFLTNHVHFPLPDPIAHEPNIGELLAILTGPPASKRRVDRTGTSR